MARGTFTKILYTGKSGGKPIVYPCEDPATLVAIGLQAGETITLEYTDEIHPVTQKKDLSPGFVDYDHPYLRLTRLNLKSNAPDFSNIYFDNTGWTFQFKDRPQVPDWAQPRIPVFYPPTRGGTIVVETEVLDPVVTGEPSDFIWGMKYVNPDNFIGWGVDNGKYKVILFENGGVNVVFTSTDNAAGGDIVTWTFDNAKATLNVNGTDLYSHNLAGDLTKPGFFGLVQYGRWNGPKDTPFMKINSITPTENRWHTIPDQEITADAPILSIYSPLLFRLNIPATANNVAIHLIKSE